MGCSSTPRCLSATEAVILDSRLASCAVPSAAWQHHSRSGKSRRSTARGVDTSSPVEALQGSKRQNKGIEKSDGAAEKATLVEELRSSKAQKLPGPLKASRIVLGVLDATFNFNVRYACPCLRGLHPSASRPLKTAGFVSRDLRGWTLCFEATRGLASGLKRNLNHVISNVLKAFPPPTP